MKILEALSVIIPAFDAEDIDPEVVTFAAFIGEGVEADFEISHRLIPKVDRNLVSFRLLDYPALVQGLHADVLTLIVILVDVEYGFAVIFLLGILRDIADVEANLDLFETREQWRLESVIELSEFKSPSRRFGIEVRAAADFVVPLDIGEVGGQGGEQIKVDPIRDVDGRRVLGTADGSVPDGEGFPARGDPFLNR